MKDFLKKMKLLDELEVNLKTSKSEFVSKLKKNVDLGSTDVFSGIFDVFSTSKNEYKGIVNMAGFEIKRKRRLFDTQFGYTKAKGTYFQDGDILRIKAEIVGWNDFMYFFFGVAILFYLVFFTLIFSSDINDAHFVIPFVLIHGFLMFFIPIRMMRRSVSRIKYDLEREFHFITVKTN